MSKNKLSQKSAGNSKDIQTGKATITPVKQKQSKKKEQKEQVKRCVKTKHKMETPLNIEKKKQNEKLKNFEKKISNGEKSNKIPLKGKESTQRKSVKEKQVNIEKDIKTARQILYINTIRSETTKNLRNGISTQDIILNETTAKDWSIKEFVNEEKCDEKSKKNNEITYPSIKKEKENNDKKIYANTSKQNDNRKTIGKKQSNISQITSKIDEKTKVKILNNQVLTKENYQKTNLTLRSNIVSIYAFSNPSTAMEPKKNDQEKKPLSLSRTNSKNEKNIFKDEFSTYVKTIPSPKALSNATKDNKEIPKVVKEKKEIKKNDSKLVKKNMKKSNRPKLEEGSKITCIGAEYIVAEHLGSGGFGDVYKIRRIDDDYLFAMKTELHTFNGKKVDRLKIEVTIMNIYCGLENPERKKHFPKIFDRGRTDSFKILVMQLLGPNIEYIRRNIIRTEFRRSTAIRISIQALQGIWDLHKIGFLHKDIKPQNFAIGLLPEEYGLIYLLDFGIARKYIDDVTQKVRSPRANVRFMGTVKYASRNCHRLIEQSRKDDLETWLYMSVEFFSTWILPWKRVYDRQIVLQEKDKFFSSPDPKIYNSAPIVYKTISKYVDKLEYEDEPDYAFIKSSLQKIIEIEKIDMNDAFEWAGIHFSSEQKPQSKNEKVTQPKQLEVLSVTTKKRTSEEGRPKLFNETASSRQNGDAIVHSTSQMITTETNFNRSVFLFDPYRPDIMR